MKTIGIIGGMTWESTIQYYRHINQVVNQQLGGLHSAQVLMQSVDFAELETLQWHEDWDGVAALMVAAARNLERAGADAVLISATTIHRVAAQVQDAITIPLLHIADSTIAASMAGGYTRLGLVGTRSTMELEFFRGRLVDAGLTVLLPQENDRRTVHNIIFEEMVSGELSTDSRAEFSRIFQEFADEGAQAIILGCTDIGPFFTQDEVPLPMLDVAIVHATNAAHFVLGSATSLQQPQRHPELALDSPAVLIPAA